METLCKLNIPPAIPITNLLYLSPRWVFAYYIPINLAAFNGQQTSYLLIYSLTFAHIKTIIALPPHGTFSATWNIFVFPTQTTHTHHTPSGPNAELGKISLYNL